MRRYTLRDFNAQFPTEDACLEWLRQHRFPILIPCPVCKAERRFHRVKARKVYECDRCGYQLSPTAGTILHKSPTLLRSWFYAVFLMASTRTGISAKQLERELGITYKTAWRMFTQIRKLMDEGVSPLTGDVEADESYYGGETHGGKRGRGAPGKTIIMGVAQRKGKIVTEVAPDVKAITLVPFIKAEVMPASTVFTDELASYNGLTKAGYEHHRVHHAAKVYVMGDAHTNTIEGFWSLTKRGIDGVHHVVSQKYLPHYLDAYSFRWNHRDDDQPMFTSLLGRVASVQEAGARGW